MAIQLIAIAVFGLFLLFVNGELYRIFSAFVIVFGIGLIVQILLFYIKPELFDDKVKHHPHEGIIR